MLVPRGKMDDEMMMVVPARHSQPENSSPNNLGLGLDIATVPHNLTYGGQHHITDHRVFFFFFFSLTREQSHFDPLLLARCASTLSILADGGLVACVVSLCLCNGFSIGIRRGQVSAKFIHC